jgi:hypothetical protein
MTIPSQPFTLSPVKPDFEGILSQLQADLGVRQDTWSDLLTAGTGETLTEWISATGAFNQLSIERSLQELFTDTALQPSSIYRICRMLGVHILRKVPAQVTVTLTRIGSEDSLTINSYSQFTINSQPFFNRSTIFMAVGQDTIDVTLYQGLVNTETFTSDGTAFQRFYVGPADFSLSNDDLFATVGTPPTTFQKTETGLWHYAGNSRVFYENTLPNGQVDILFGNNIYGQSPSIDDQITFYYTTTLGSAGILDRSGDPVTLNGSAVVNGITISTIQQGANERPIKFYKLLAADLYAARRRMVTRRDHNAIVRTYPGVLDCKIRGQAEVAPGDLRWMNNLDATLITDPVWSVSQWNQFKIWAQDRFGIATTHFNRHDPTLIPTEIEVEIYCFNQADLTTTANLVRARLEQFFEVGLGSLGASYYLSDIDSIVINTVDDTAPDITQDVEEFTKLVDYCKIIKPTDNILLSPLQYTTATITVRPYYSTRQQVEIVA